TARPIAVSTLLAAAAGSAAHVVADLLEDWTDGVAAALRQALPGQGRSLAAGEPAEIGIGEAAWPATRQVWFRARGGELGLFDLRPRWGGPSALLPLPPQAWVRAYTDVELAPQATEDVLADPELWE